MTNKNILIIGSSGGIGKAFIDIFAKQNANNKIIGLSRSENKDIENIYAHHFLDLEDESSIEIAARQVEEHGPYQLIIVTTGVLYGDDFSPEKSLRHISAENFKKVLNINTIGPALVGKSFLPLLDKKNPSVFGFLSARVGSISDNKLGGWHAYRASKASLNMLIKNFAIELARTNKLAKVIGLHPGTVDTELSKPFQKNVPENKLFTPKFSADAMINVINGLKDGDSGSVFAFDGTKIDS
tara:strand:- start:624 stop:1346 length:723 start_codon:yes stop_codon:yes gene_type:complete